VFIFIGRMSKFVSKVKSAVSFRSSRIDPPSPIVESSSCQASTENLILLKDKKIKLQDDCEKKIYRELKDQKFTHTLAFNPTLLQTIGMDSEFELVFKNVGWEKCLGTK
jgi:hypothetical protein